MASFKARIPALPCHRDDIGSFGATRVPLFDAIRECHGPGWFESSWDLQRGLEVHEGLPADCRWQEWVEVWLRG